MKPISSQHLLKSVAAFIFLLLQIHVSAQTNSYYAKANGNFSTLSNWKNSVGKPPKQIEITEGTADFIIQDGFAITLNESITVASLSIETGGTLNLATANLTIRGNLNINTGSQDLASGINFGTTNNLVTVTGSLNGGGNSFITHNASGKFKNELVLKGKTNTLAAFTNKSTGTSIVRYAGASQTVFNSDGYQDLYLEGSGTKVLSSLPKTTLDGTMVTHLFSITNCRLRLGDFNFSYGGLQSNLTYSDGWVITNGTGMYKNLTAENTVTFPVGDATNMQAIQLSNSTKSTTFDVGFSDFKAYETENESIADGMGVWYIRPADPTDATVTLLQPVASASPLVKSSKIAVYTNNVWETQPTVYESKYLEYTAKDIPLTNKNMNSIGMVTCPTFTLATTTLPEATPGVSYNEDIQINGTTGGFGIVDTLSSPAGFSVSRGKGIRFTNKNPGTDNYTITFTVRDAMRCQTGFKVSINIKSLITAWDGKSWSNGVPDASKDVYIQGNYTTVKEDTLKAKNLVVDENVTLDIIHTSALLVSGTLANKGTIVTECGGMLTYNEFKGNDIKDYNPVFAPASLEPAIAGQDYKQYFTANDAAKNLDMEEIPKGFDFFAADGLLVTNTAPKPGAVTFTLTYSENDCIARKNYTIKFIDQPSPNLSIAPIGAKTVDDDAFKLGISTRSRGDITYSITSGTCASIGKPTVNLVTLNGCAGTITVQASQDATDLYKAQTVTQTFTILPGKGKMRISNFAFLVKQNSVIKVITKSTNISFEQIKGFDVATVSPTGAVAPLKAGNFSVHISLAATADYTAFDSVYTFNVFALQKPPVAVADTIVLETGKDSTFNILDNDMGMTDVITTDQTDIDIENRGVQVKYYATELGTFNIDAEGNLTVKPFYGFIGSNRIGYTVTDANGLTSEIAYIHVTVTPPYVVPELKANQVMTPNNDNLNDALVIGNTDLNQENSLTILDETGNAIYEKTDYQNDWEGIDKNGNALQAGVYFYVFKEKATGRELSNFIQIIKQ